MSLTLSQLSYRGVMVTDLIQRDYVQQVGFDTTASRLRRL